MKKNSILVATLPELACFALLPAAQAAAVDYNNSNQNFTTAEGKKNPSKSVSAAHKTSQSYQKGSQPYLKSTVTNLSERFSAPPEKYVTNLSERFSAPPEKYVTNLSQRFSALSEKYVTNLSERFSAPPEKYVTNLSQRFSVLPEN